MPDALSPVAKLAVSKEHRFLCWSALNEAQLHSIQSADSLDEKKRLIAQTFHLSTNYPDSVPQSSVRRQVYVQLILTLLQFSADNHLTPLKSCTLLGIAHRLHRVNCDLEQISSTRMPAQPAAERVTPPVSVVWRHFLNLLLQHSVERPPFTVCIFTQSDVESISQFVLHSYIRHLRMYQLVFSKRHELTLQVQNSIAQVIPTAQLAQALRLDACQDYTDIASVEQAAAAEAAALAAAQRQAAAEAEAKVQQLLAAQAAADPNKAQADAIASMQSDFQKLLSQQLSAFNQRLADIEQRTQPPGQNSKKS